MQANSFFNDRMLEMLGKKTTSFTTPMRKKFFTPEQKKLISERFKAASDSFEVKKPEVKEVEQTFSQKVANFFNNLGSKENYNKAEGHYNK